ncbi:MAG TPA: SDR family oxidoreductase [Negativicutes bacterium]
MKIKVLVTGVTGLLGSCTVIELLENYKDIELVFLVRASNAEAGLERMRKSLSKAGAKAKTLVGLTEGQVICGDLGSAVELARDPRLQEITHVFNCAAVTAFSQRPSISKVNVDDTLVFAKMVSTLPNMKRFLYIGTAMICGNSPNRIIHEDDFPAKTQHFVPYTKSKAEAESLLAEALGRIPLVVVRPSIVVGHSRLGCKPSTSIFWVFRILYQAWRSPFPLDYKIDVLPADYVAQAIAYLGLKKELAFSRYHIAAGSEFSNTFLEIMNTFRKCARQELNTPLVVTIDHYAENKDKFNEWFGPGNPRLILRAINLYYNFANLNVTFDNSRLLAEGFACPPRFTDYLELCIKTGCDAPVSEQMIDDFK